MLAANSHGLLATTASFRQVEDAFSAEGMVQAYLDFEAGLARAQARVGVIPQEHADTITAACLVSNFDLNALEVGAAHVGYPVVTLVKMLSDACGSKGGDSVHLGATSQDVMDTGLVLVAQKTLLAILPRLDHVCNSLSGLALAHRGTIMAGRSKGQHAAPVTLGFRAAVWLDLINRLTVQLTDATTNAAVLQFGGAVGTLAAHGPNALNVRAALAAELDLAEPDISWHVVRDRLGTLVHTIALTVSGLAKIGQDIAVLSATELGEVSEPRLIGRGSSSTMPQKRNPVLCEALIEAARLVRPNVTTMLEAQIQEFERGLGFAYLERRSVSDSIAILAGATDIIETVIDGLEVVPDAMRRNMENDRLSLMSEAAFKELIPSIGRVEAHKLVTTASSRAKRDGTDLLAAIRAELLELNVEFTFNLLPESHLGEIDAMIDRVVQRVQSRIDH